MGQVENRADNLIKNTGILAIGTFLPKLTSFVTLPVLTACLSKAEYGTYDLIATLISLILPIATMKLEAGCFRFLIDVRTDIKASKEIISTATIFIIPISFIVVAILYFVLDFGIATNLIVCVYFFLDNIYSALKQIVRGLAKNHIYSLSSVIQAVLNMILIVVVVGKAGKGLNGLLTALCISICVAGMVIFRRISLAKYLSFRAFSQPMLKKMISYSWPMLPNSLSAWVMRLSDRLVVTAVLGVEVNAVYAVANKIPQLFSLAQNTFAFAWQENASMAVADDNADEYYSQMYDTIFQMLSGMMAGLIAVTPIIFKLLIRGDYADAYYQMPMLFGGMYFSALSSFLGGIYIAHMRTKNVGFTTVIAAASNFIINVGLIHMIGLYAASFSTLSSYFILWLYRLVDIRKFQKIKYKTNKMILYLAFLILMSILCYINSYKMNIVNLVIGMAFAIGTNWKLAYGLIVKIICWSKRRYNNKKI